MNLSKILTLTGVAAFLASPVAAQTVGIGTTKTGATSQVSAGIASIASKFGGMQMRPAPMAGTQKYIPAVNSGSLEFGGFLNLFIPGGFTPAGGGPTGLPTGDFTGSNDCWKTSGVVGLSPIILSYFFRNS